MKKIEKITKGYVIKKISSGLYLMSDNDNQFGSVDEAHVFRLKSQAAADIKHAETAKEEVIEKIEKRLTIIIL